MCKDYEYLSEILKEFNRLDNHGYGLFDSIHFALKKHDSGFDKGDDGVPLVVYKGKHVLIFGQVGKIYEEC